MLILRNAKSTVLIAGGCANALFIFGLLNLYLTTMVVIGGYIVSLKFADAGLFNISIFACICGFLHLSIEQILLLALDLELKERANIFGKTLKQEKPNGIDKYFSEATYFIGRNIAYAVLLCFCDITDRVMSGLTRTVGNVWYSWRASYPTRRELGILEFGSTASAVQKNLQCGLSERFRRHVKDRSAGNKVRF